MVRRKPKPAPIRRIDIRTGDTVQVISGNDRGKSGEVVRIDRIRGRVVVKGINLRWRHLKKGPKTPQGGREQREASIHVSNVQLFDAKTGKGTRLRHEVRDGKKVRVAKRSGEVIYSK